jgi:3-dehydroquinate dehydratase
MNLEKLSKICLSIKYLNDNTISYAKSLTNLIELRLEYNYLNNIIIQNLYDNFQTTIIKSNKLNDYNLYDFNQYKDKIILDYDFNSLLNNNLNQFIKNFTINYIISLHNIKLNTIYENNFNILKKMIDLNPIIVKLVIEMNSINWKDIQKEIYKQFNLIKKDKNCELICFFEGEEMKESRIYSLKLGAPFTYCAFDENSKTGNGQYTCSELIMNGLF